MSKGARLLRRLAVLTLFVGQALPGYAGTDVQINLTGTNNMPKTPTAFDSTWNWRQRALDYDNYAFGRVPSASYIPLWWDTSQINFPRTIFALPDFIGWNTGYPSSPTTHEAMTAMGAVIGATLVGIDKSNQDGHNYVEDCRNYYNSANGQNIFLQFTSSQSGASFWNDLLPNIYAYALYHYYPNGGITSSEIYTVATRWRDATYVMGAANANFNYTAFNFATMSPVNNGSWIEPDAAGGVGYLDYLSYVKFGDSNHLQGADWAMTFLHNRPSNQNPTYEMMVAYGAYTAARMNGELGRTYDLQKIMNWCFGQTNVAGHGDWGMITKNFGSYGAHGLVGMRASSSYYNGYGFAMNTFAHAFPILPVARYDDRYARAIGRWISNAANNARLFYAQSLPATKQSSYTWAYTSNNDPTHCYAYEGLKCTANGQTPYASGDALAYGWASTDFGLYGSSIVGFFGGTLTRTNNTYIWQIDCLKTDVFHADAYPTYLYYNPHTTASWVQLDVGASATALYDSVTNNFISTANNQKTGVVSFLIPADTAMVLVLVPDGSTKTVNGQKTTINGKVVDYVYTP